MDTLDFLQRVLPSEGLYVSIIINDGDRPRQGFLNNINDLAKGVRTLSDRGNNVYYAVASFADRAGGRKQNNVHKIKALYLDVDCGEDKPFATWKDGLRALGKFITDTGLPNPMIVRSGNGLHVYWVLDRDYDLIEWQPVANALKAATSAHKFAVDLSVPADSARVLRPVGTINPKGGNVVALLLDAAPVDLDTMAGCLSQYTVARPTTVHTPKRTSLLDNLAVKQDFPPADSNVLVEKCAQISWAVTHQDKVTEPMWYALMGIAAYCVDPEQTAISWSENHPSFSPDATVQKLEQWKNSATGPATCARFDSERPEGCKNCKFAGKITSPVRLSVQHAVVAPPDDVPDEIAKTVPMPWPFKRTATGIKKTIDDVDVDVCKFDIYPMGYGRDETLGYETVRFKWNRPHAGWQTLAFRQAYLVQGNREFGTAIADQGIVLNNNKQTEEFQFMLRSYMEELRQLQSMSNLYASMGWKENKTQFLLGDTLFKRNADGSVTKETASFASQTQRIIEPMFTSAGTVEEFAKFTSLLEKANMPIHMFMLGVALSAPLYEFTGLKGLTINLYGPTGAGKTLAQYWQQAVWGDPTKLHYTAKFTANALYSRMGLYNNLPVTIDETTMLQPKEVGDFLYSVSQGREKARLTRTAEERDTKTWSTVVSTSSNRSMSSMLVASGLETDAQMARLLEVTIYAHPLFTRSTVAGKQIYEFITTHYGTVGPVFVNYLLDLGEEGIRDAVEKHKKEFYAQYNAVFTGSERYWEQAIVLADFAGKIAKSLGLIQFDYTRGTKEILTQIGAMRIASKENLSDSFDVLTEYINAHSGQTVTVMHTGSNKPQPDHGRMPRGEVHVRFDVYRPTTTDTFNRGTVFVDRTHFRKWLSVKGADYRTLVREITEQGVNATPKTEKAFLGKDTGIKLGQQYVLGVSLTHPRLIGVLTDLEDTALNNTLTVVQGGIH